VVVRVGPLSRRRPMRGAPVRPRKLRHDGAAGP
jgi:hypothetical protein